ncbi:MAG TPA: PKD domain-containing protein, partial [Tepiditoga sp.]|nr:PKD domain-containing protein [Tepiditoga sp.]
KINSVQEFYDKGNIEISGEAFSPEGRDISDEIVWYSDLQGEIGKGAVIKPDLKAGKHIIVAKISGAESTVSITVLGEAVLSIESPLSDSVYYGETEFKASATDKDQTVSDEIMWISNLEGEIGKGSEFTQELKEGKHTITAVFKSKFGETYTKTVDIDVAAENSEVSLEIPQEFNGQIVFAGNPVNLYVYLTGTDETIEWYSDLEGLIGEGSNVEIIFTKTGEHKITVKAGNVSASIILEVAEFEEEKLPFGVVMEVSGRVYSDSEITVGTVVFYDEIINIEKNSYVKILKTDATYYEKRNNSGNTVQDVLGEVKK